MKEDALETGGRVLDEIPFGIWVASASTGEVLYENQSFRAIMGVEGLGDALAPAPVPPEFFDRQGNPYPARDLPFGRALASGEPVVVDDLVVHRRDGRRVYVRAFANPVRDDEGVVSHVVIALADITAEVRAVVERGEIAKHLEVAIHHAPVLLFMIDAAGVVTAADGALHAALSSEKGGMIGRSLFEAYKDEPVVVENVRRALAGQTVSYSVEVLKMMLDVWIGPAWNAAGERAGAIGICTDVTEARRLQTRIIQDDRVRAMGTVAASVAHEINNPLTYVLAGLEEAKLEIESLSATLEALRGAGDETAVATALRGMGRLNEHLGPVAAGINRIRDVTRDLKTFSRPDDERLAQVDLAAVVRSVLSLLRKEIEVRARLVEELGTSPPVLANEARMVQVLTNLLMNAWQALPAPDPLRHVIGVRTGTQDGQALVEIWDSGPGISPQDRERIFEPFVTTKDIGGGTGLGLFVCRNVVEAMHGRITVGAAPGGGALFRIVLPAAVGKTGASTRAPAAHAGGKSKERRLRVLIVDDEAMVASALAARLSREHFEVRTVLDARRAVDILLADDEVDLAYCDVMMKDFTGIDLHEALSRRAPQRLSKVVFMTAGAFTAEAREFLEHRRATHVQKPFDIAADARRRMAAYDG